MKREAKPTGRCAGNQRIQVVKSYYESWDSVQEIIDAAAQVKRTLRLSVAKPCPFCGKQPELDGVPCFNSRFGLHIQYRVGCSELLCAQPKFWGFRDLSETIAAWNTRTNEDGEK